MSFRRMSQLSVSFGFMALLTVVASAQQSQQSQVPDVDTKILTGKITIENSQNLYADSDYSKINNTELGLNPILAVGGTWKLSALVIVGQEHSGARNTVLSRTALNLAPAEMATGWGQIQWRPTLMMTLPTDAIERRENRYQGSIGAGSSLHLAEVSSRFPLDATWMISVLKHTHEYNLNAEGEPLVEWAARSRIALDYPITESFSVSLLSDLIQGRTYGGQARTLFANHLDLNFSLWRKILSLNFGVSTEGNALKYNGLESNYSFFNENVSVVRMGVTYVF